MNGELNLFTEQTNFVKEQKNLSFDNTLENIPLANRNENYYEKIMPELTAREDEVLRNCKLMDKSGLEITINSCRKFMQLESDNIISGRFGKLVEKKKLLPISKTKEKRPKTIYKVI